MKRFCYICGALESSENPLVNGLCPRCLSERLRVLEVPSKIVLTICRSCGAVKSGAGWSGEDAVLEQEILRQVKVSPAVDGKISELLSPADFVVEVYPDLQKSEVEVVARRKAGKPQFREEKTTKLEIRWKTCDGCSLRHGGHYEVVLQVRADADLEKLKEQILSMVSKLESSKDFLVQVKPVERGFDFYLSSVRVGKKLVSFMRRRNFTVKESKKLIGQTHDGRKRYRFTYLVEPR